MAETVSTINAQGLDLNLEDTTARESIKALNTQISELSDSIPTKLSDLRNDKNYVSSADVPSKMSQLTNDKGYALSSDIPTKVSALANDLNYVKASSVPTKTSDLTNDMGFVTASSVPTKVSQLENNLGYVTAGDIASAEGITIKVDLSDYYTKSEVDEKIQDVDLTNYYTKDQVDDIASQVKSDIVDGAPEALDTLKEISDALSDDDDAIASLVTTISGKASSTDVYTKTEADTKYATKDDITDLDTTATDDEVNYVLGKEE